MNAAQTIRIADETQNWEHAGQETTPAEIAEHYRTAGWQQLGYYQSPGKATQVEIEVQILDEDGDIADVFDTITVEIPAGPEE